ncbi:phage DNA ejection protein [Serratia ureilytica]|uniref:phage DNA ejection protein n=1 Tax=Serratia ureilytica TaxID=300181 RepID=UPI00249CB25C|nr:phage DNA ejection protein [Serratia ureilytica]MDI3197135.1 phage DNA ejection protein [Serratia ureilytica]
MATWQQGNAGGLLAGIGTNNANAPQASDANTALSLIRDNNDRERAGENNLGVQLAGAAGSLANTWKQTDLQQRQKAFQQDYANAYASGDRGAMRGLVAKYPEQFEAMRNGMGFVDEDQRNTVGNLAASARLASQSPEAMGQWLQKNAGDLTRVGVNPSDVAQMYQQNPAGFGQFVDHLGMASLGLDKYYDLQDKLQGRDIAQQNANTSTFSAQQNVRQGDERLAIDRYKAQSGADLAAEELKLKALLGKAQNDTARGNLQQKLDVVNKARDEKINSVAGNVADFGRAAAVGTELGSLVNQHPTAVSRNQGGLMGWAPNVADDTRTLASKTDEYNLKVILPALKGTFGGNPTEGERAALMQSSNNLKKATSNEDFLKELNKAQDTIVQMQKRQIRGLGIPVTRSRDEATDTQMLLSDPSLVEEYIRAHGYLPESYYQAQLKGAK